MVPQQAQRLRWEDDVDIYLWCDKGRVFDDDESILFLPLLASALADAHPSFPFLHPFASSFATTVHFTDARRLFLDRPSLSPFSHLGAASPPTQCN